MSVGQLVACGVRMATTPSMLGSWISVSSAADVAVGVRVPAHVDRVADGGEVGQEILELVHRLGRQLGELAAELEQPIGGHDARAAGVGHDGQPRPRGLI